MQRLEQQLRPATCVVPRDAIHAATTLLHGASELISEDADFDKVDGLRRRWMR